MVKDDSRTLSILTHILGWLTGFLGPLVILLVSKDNYVKKHTKNALNWQISYAIYMIASLLLMIILIGFLTFFALILLNIIFSIIAAVKASQDKLWKYPLTISFLK